MSDTRNIATSAEDTFSPFTVASQNIPNIALPPAASASAASTAAASPATTPRTAAASPRPSTPGGTPKPISMTGKQGFIFSLHQSRVSSKYVKFIKTMKENPEYKVIDLNSSEFMGEFICTEVGNEFFTFLRKHKNIKSIYEFSAMPDFSSILLKANLAGKININTLILNAMEELVRQGVTTLNYFGDFNTGHSGQNVCHMPHLISQLENKAFLDSNEHGVKVELITSPLSGNTSNEAKISTIALRCFLDGSGGADDVAPYLPYVNMSAITAKAQYHYSGYNALYAVTKISMDMDKTEKAKQLKRNSASGSFASVSMDSAPGTPASRSGTGSPMLPPVHPHASQMSPSLLSPSTKQRSFLTTRTPVASPPEIEYELEWPNPVTPVTLSNERDLEGPQGPNTSPSGITTNEELSSSPIEEISHEARSRRTLSWFNPATQDVLADLLSKEAGASSSPTSINPSK